MDNKDDFANFIIKELERRNPELSFLPIKYYLDSSDEKEKRRGVRYLLNTILAQIETERDFFYGLEIEEWKCQELQGGKNS